MGWFDSDKEGVLYSDETLDAAHSFLVSFSEAYQRDLKRLPSVEELEYLLRLSFRTGANSSILADFSERQITDVKLKIAPVKKKQTCAVGDVFAVPLPSGGFGFGRIINLDKTHWFISEIFDFFSNFPMFTSKILDAKWLIYPVITPPSSYFENWTFPIIFNNPKYICPVIDKLEYVSGSPGNYWINKVGEYGKGPTISDKAAAEMSTYSLRSPSGLAAEIEARLKDSGKIPSA